MRRPRRPPFPVGLSAALLAVALVAASCSSDGDDTAAEGTSSVPTDGSSTTVTLAESSTTLAASTASTVSSTTTTEATTTTEVTTTEATATIETTTTTEATTAPQPTLIDGGSSYSFTSPSGNIACSLTTGSGGWVSCWIGLKDWEIDQPDGPDCDISDWGNAVDLGPDGPSFPCYTDFGWDPFADSLDYGLTVAVGEFRCESARTGVTCTNGSGQGFSLARAAVELF